jgi:hypothetical protein
MTRGVWIGATAAAVVLVGAGGAGAWLAGSHADAAPAAQTPDGAGLRIAYAPPPPPPRLPPPNGEKLEVLSASVEPARVSDELAAAENANLMRRMEAEEDRANAAQAAELRRQDAALTRELHALEAPPAPDPSEDAAAATPT